jgi:hypothetical protein
MKRKQRFLKAVQILAPGDKFVLEAAQRVPEESLPVASGGAALELVVALQKLMTWSSQNSSDPNPKRPDCRWRRSQDHVPLSMSHALRVQAAHFWLKLGEANLAVRELERLPHHIRSHTAVVKARVAVTGVLRERSEATVKE